MKVAVVLCLAASLAITAALPPPGGFGGFMPPGGFGGIKPPGGFGGIKPPGGFGGFMPPAAGVFMPSPAMIQSFIPSPGEIAALNALRTTPAPGVVPTPALGPTPPPTMPPAVANLVQKYQSAATAFMPPAAGAV